MSQPTTQPIALLRVPAILPFYGTAKSQFHQDVRDGLVTKPIKPSHRLALWPQNEIAAINAARIAGKTPDEIRELVKKLEADRQIVA